MNSDFRPLCKSEAKPLLHGFIVSLFAVIVAITVDFAIGVVSHGVL